MVSTGWRTACAVIVIIVGAALLTFAVFVYRRRNYFGRAQNRPEMRQRFMSSQADDPEAHISLLNASEMMPPVPPKTPAMSHGRSFSGGRPSFPSHDRSTSYGSADELGEPFRERTRSAPTRVPVPPLFPEPEIDVERVSYQDGEPDAPMSMPEPSLPSSPSLLDRIHFPRIQLNTQGGRKGRMPSLKISFVRESNQAISSPGNGYRPPSHLEGRPPSASSGPSSLSRPFATMSKSPLPPIRPVSPLSLVNTNISIHAQSPSTRAATPQDPPQNANWDSSAAAAPPPGSPLPPEHEAERLSASSPTSITTVGLDNFSRNLFTRNLSTDGSSSCPSFTVSRGSSYQTGRPISMSDVARHSSLSSGSGSGAGAGAGSASGQGLRRATTWVPNVLAPYSPWHNVVPMPGGGDAHDPASSPSPTGQLRVADAYRPMPTLQENPSETASVSPITLPRSLPESTQGTYTGRSVSVREVRLAGGQIAGAVEEERRPSMGSVAESIAHVQAQAAEVLLPSPYDHWSSSMPVPAPSPPVLLPPVSSPPVPLPASESYRAS
ncbi:hypothetical protein LXA43DRAFT_512182 [Ganoderma leucocontextum]|nr:hypothetical protein LXA43DRAFT_512182 [Ganoderma leucocontextum]